VLISKIKVIEGKMQTIRDIAYKRGEYDGHELVYKKSETDALENLRKESRKLIGLAPDDIITLSVLIKLIKEVTK